MKKKEDPVEYVVVPESVAMFLDRSVAAGSGFGFSSADEDDCEEEAALPSSEHARDIKIQALSRKQVSRLDERGELDRTVYPLVTYYPQVMGVSSLSSASVFGSKDAVTLGAGKSWTVKVIDRESGRPLEGVSVAALGGQSREEAQTDANGEAFFSNVGSSVGALFVLPNHTYWSRVESDVDVGANIHVVELAAMDTQTPTCLDLVRKKAIQAGRGAKVRVGIIDSGVGPHPDITVTGGSAPLSEPGASFEDSNMHGTHVAGIVAGKGKFPGVAPECEIRSYRVSRLGRIGAANADVVNAIFAAVRDGCHIINISMGSKDRDVLVDKAIKRAMESGVLVVAAAGNDGRSAIHSPARISGVVSVGAMGCDQSYPRDSAHTIRECVPKGITPSHYVANFSNKSSSLQCVAPGVGVVSTVPGGYLALDGTSMAAPVVTGIAACLLSANPKILRQKANNARTEAMRRLLYTACNSLGFPANLEGKNGLPS